MRYTYDNTIPWLNYAAAYRDKANEDRESYNDMMKAALLGVGDTYAKLKRWNDNEEKAKSIDELNQKYDFLNDSDAFKKWYISRLALGV